MLGWTFLQKRKIVEGEFTCDQFFFWEDGEKKNARDMFSKPRTARCLKKKLFG